MDTKKFLTQEFASFMAKGLNNRSVPKVPDHNIYDFSTGVESYIHIDVYTGLISYTSNTTTASISLDTLHSLLRQVYDPV